MRTEKEADAGGGSKKVVLHSHVMLLVLSCARGGDMLDVFIANHGPGTQYHAAKPDAETGGLLLQLPMRMRQVSNLSSFAR